MASQKAIFIAPNTGKQLQVTVEQRSDGIRIFFDQGNMIEDADIPHDKAREFEGQREYLFYSKGEYEELMKLKGPGLVLISPAPMAAGRRLKKRRATRRAKKHTRRSRS